MDWYQQRIGLAYIDIGGMGVGMQLKAAYFLLSICAVTLALDQPEERL
jgi:hypothetical protein